MKGKRVKLYDRLPEIYRIKDEGQSPPDQLKNYLGLVDGVFDAIHENIESLYDDLFIETCDNWVISYIADLLGTSHLSGDPWTLRADVADTIALRRRKGTLGAIEKLTYDLTQWGVHCVELRESLVWNQHLNHQRPDAGGKPAYGHISDIKNEEKAILRTRAIRGGTVNLRDPALLSLINSPFDPFAHIGDMRPADFGNIRYNLPDLAVFLWRLKDYRIGLSKPKANDNRPDIQNTIGTFIIRMNVHPMGEPIMLFNTHRLDPDKDTPVLTDITKLTRIDETPGPIPAARLTKGSAAGNFRKYVDIKMYSDSSPSNPAQDRSEVGLQLHFPSSIFPGETLDNWSIRGRNLCAWEEGLTPPLMNREIAIDPDIGRIVIGVKDNIEWTALSNSLNVPICDQLWLTHTYGAVGPVGAHPISRSDPPYELMGEDFMTRRINLYHYDLNDALTNLQFATATVIIEINDSATHELDLGSSLMALMVEDGGPNLKLNKSLIIRATNYQRPVIKLLHPLRFRPENVNDAAKITVRLEGLYITRHEDFKDGEPLIGRAAIHKLEIINCTLDPGGSKKLDKSAQGSRNNIQTSMVLKEPYGFKDQEEEDFDQTPDILIERSITGPLKIDTGYTLLLRESIIDAGSGVNFEPEKASFAVTGATKNSWGPATKVESITVFGRMRVESITGKGGIWVHALEAQDNQKGCIKFSYFSGEDNERLPQHHGCVSGKLVILVFTSEVFGNPAYGQLAHSCDFQIREKGPDDDAMGAFGFLKEAHKWRNIQIRFREFMPVGVRLLMIPVT